MIKLCNPQLLCRIIIYVQLFLSFFSFLNNYIIELQLYTYLCTPNRRHNQNYSAIISLHFLSLTSPAVFRMFFLSLDLFLLNFLAKFLNSCCVNFLLFTILLILAILAILLKLFDLIFDANACEVNPGLTPDPVNLY